MSYTLRPEVLPKGYEWVAGLVAKPGRDFEISGGESKQQGYEKCIFVGAKNRGRSLTVDYSDAHSMVQAEGIYNSLSEKFNRIAITSRSSVVTEQQSTDLFMHVFELVPHLASVTLGYFSESGDGVAKFKTLDQVITPTQNQLDMIFATPIPHEHTVGTIAHLLLMGKIEELSKTLDYNLTFDTTRNANNHGHSWVFMQNWKPTYKAGDTLSAIALMDWKSGEAKGTPHLFETTIDSNDVIGVTGNIAIDGGEPTNFVKSHLSLGTSREDTHRDPTLLVSKLFKATHKISSN